MNVINEHKEKRKCCERALNSCGRIRHVCNERTKERTNETNISRQVKMCEQNKHENMQSCDLSQYISSNSRSSSNNNTTNHDHSNTHRKTEQFLLLFILLPIFVCSSLWRKIGGVFRNNLMHSARMKWYESKEFTNGTVHGCCSNKQNKIVATNNREQTNRRSYAGSDIWRCAREITQTKIRDTTATPSTFCYSFGCISINAWLLATAV